MKIRLAVAALSCALVAGLGAAPARGQQGETLVREILRQQSPAERQGCDGVQRALAGGTDAGLVVRTACQMGYNSCLVIRCALEGKADVARVAQGAAAAGVQPDVIARCSIEAGADEGVVALVLAETLFDPNYCYFAPRPLSAPDPLPAIAPVIGRSTPPSQASPFTP